MLVLTRKLMERLYIGDEICVTVVRLEGGQVRLGIEAPRSISVVRAELLPDGGRSILEAAGHKELLGTAKRGEMAGARSWNGDDGCCCVGGYASTRRGSRNR